MKKFSPVMKTILPSIIVAGGIVFLKTEKTYAGGETVNDAKNTIQSDIWRAGSQQTQNFSCHSNCHSSCHGNCGRKGW